MTRNPILAALSDAAEYEKERNSALMSIICPAEPLRCEVMVTEAWDTDGTFAQQCNSTYKVREIDGVWACEACRREAK